MHLKWYLKRFYLCSLLAQAYERREGGRTQRDQRDGECGPKYRDHLPVWSQWTGCRRWEETGMPPLAGKQPAHCLNLQITLNFSVTTSFDCSNWPFTTTSLFWRHCLDSPFSHQLQGLTMWKQTERSLHLTRNKHSLFYLASFSCSSAAFLRTITGGVVTCAARSCWTLQNGDLCCCQPRKPEASIWDRKTQRGSQIHYICKQELRKPGLRKKAKNRPSKKVLSFSGKTEICPSGCTCHTTIFNFSKKRQYNAESVKANKDLLVCQ